MKNAHPVELLLLAAVVTLEAFAVLLAALVAVLLTLARWRPAPPETAPAPPPAPAPPAVNPLQLVADAAVEALEPCTVAQLRHRARAAGLPRCLSHRGRRDALLEALAGLEVAC
jgi:hypothetical protein